MSPTLLEWVIGLILLVVAWQIGITIAPLIFREWRYMKRSLDEVSSDIDAEEHIDQRPKEQHHDPHS